MTYAMMFRIADRVRDACAKAEGFASYADSDWTVNIREIIDAEIHAYEASVASISAARASSSREPE